MARTSVPAGQEERETFGTDARDQYTVEAYYRLQLPEHLAITPDIQLIKDPALNPDDDFVGLRGFAQGCPFERLCRTGDVNRDKQDCRARIPQGSVMMLC